MISLRQLRAARALLGWKQSDLAIKSGFSLTALNNIERGVVSPRASTMDVVQDTFERSGIVFTEEDGLKMRSETFDIKTFEGTEEECVAAHFQDVLDTLARDGGMAMYGGVDESYYTKHHRAMMFSFYQEFTAEKFKERILICEGVKERYGPKQTSDYRALPKDLFGMISYAVYGNKYALIMLGKKSRWMAVEHKNVAQMHKQLFETHWKLGRHVPYTRALYEVDLEKADVKA